MTATIYLVKRRLRERRRNGQRTVRWALRWQDPVTRKWCCETTGTADRTEAESVRKLKWAEVNGLVEPAEEVEPEPAAARPCVPWRECADLMARAMEADNLRPSYLQDAALTLEGLRRMFPEANGPGDITTEEAHEWKRKRAETGVSPWTTKGDLATLKAVFGKWLCRELGLLSENPFKDVKAPRCDDPDVRIVSADETQELFGWLDQRWNGWRLPKIYLEVAALVGWRATEIASMREEDILADGFLRVAAKRVKTRRHKYGWLPADLHAELRACAAGVWAFGRFSDELRRLLILWKKRPHHAAKVRDYSPKRLVGWVQDELKRFCDGREGERFTLHDFRRTAITGMQMAGVSEKETSVMVWPAP